MGLCARLILLTASLSLGLSGCGGGGGGSSSSAPAATPPAAAVAAPAPATCTATTVTSGNAQTICVSGGVTNGFTNVVSTSVTVCLPNTSTCMTIPGVQVDTGSTGLRLFHSQIASLGLAPVTDGTNAYGECGAFADGEVWGTMATADVKLAGETASGISIQVILDDGTGPPIPADCSDQGANNESTQASLGVNGILGVGQLVADCGADCVTSATFQGTGASVDAQYYTCSGNTCSPSTIPLAKQVTNPVAAFPTDNNGVILTIPAIPDTGYTSVNATMIFGIDTESNNQLRKAIVIGTPQGNFNVTYNGQAFSQSFIDSGSSAYFFDDSTIADCAQSSPAKYYLCPGVTTSLSLETPELTITSPSPNGGTVVASVKVANGTFLLDQANGANLFLFDDIAAPAGTTFSDSFDLGVPFFYNKALFTGFETNPNGPYFAWITL